MKTTKNAINTKECDATRQAVDWEKQRGNMASVVHDEICPMLTFLMHDMFWIEKNSECRTIKTRASHCIDQLSVAMNRCKAVLLGMQHTAVDPSLSESLQCMIDNFHQIAGVVVSSEIDPDIDRLGNEQQSVVYRSVQEALSNAFKHAHAEHVHVSAKIILRQVHIRVVDDGIGLGYVELSPAFCIGLKMQKQRAIDMAGHFSIENNLNGKGTKMHLSFPLVSDLIYS
jgi:signal transduction histidine kinase